MIVSATKVMMMTMAMTNYQQCVCKVCKYICMYIGRCVCVCFSTYIYTKREKTDRIVVRVYLLVQNPIKP